MLMRQVMKKGIKDLAAIILLSGLGLAGGALFAAEFEVLDRFSVDGYTVLRGSADIPGGSFSVGGSTFVIKGGSVGIGTTNPAGLFQVGGGSFTVLNSGNVGIGTTAPGARLDVGGGVKLANDEGVCDPAKAGTIRFTGTNFQGCTGTSWLTLENSPPSVASVSPDNGAMGGLYAITITGSGFGTPAVLTIGGNPATNIVTVSGTQITATVPASSSSGAKDVVVRNPDGLLSTFSGGFRYNPGVTGVNPGSGPINSGTVLTLTGAGFVNGAAVYINNVLASNITWNSSTQMTATSPSTTASGGAKDVKVANPDGGYGVLSGGFRYDPVIAAVSPASGRTSTIITITGTGFEANVGVTIGGLPATGVSRVSDSEIRANPPASPTSDAKDVRVTNTDDGGYGVKTLAFTHKVYATGGVVVGAYIVHTFTSVGNSTFHVDTAGNVEVLAVAGGGGGGWTNVGSCGGGGGAGGLIYNSAFAVTAGDYTVTVGAGGAERSAANSVGCPSASGCGTGYSGGDSYFGSMRAFGGGGGAGYKGLNDGYSYGASGGSGGGSENNSTQSSSIQTSNNGGTGYGNKGGATVAYNAGGGGGAGAAGSTGGSTAGGAGGIGKYYDISGTNTPYAGGGGGGIYNNGTSGGAGGLGGGGAGGNSSGSSGIAGTPNTGGGGGGRGTFNVGSGVGGAGGSGIVIVRYPN